MDWEAQYRQGDTPWDKGEASPGLVDYLQTHTIAGEVLVPGCGSGHDVRVFSAAGATVTGLDLAPTAISLARSIPPAGNERYEQGNFFDLPQHLRDRFDWVVEHTCFCAIDTVLRPQYVEAAATALKPGGHLLAIFYMTPNKPGDGPPHGSTPAELDSLFSPRFRLLEDWQPTKNYPSRIGKERMRLMQRL